MTGPADTPTAATITDYLLQAQGGDRDAVERLFPLIYAELRRIAHSALRRERDDHTLGTTGLVHEAYLKLVVPTRVGWEGRRHFFGLAARAMRQILVDYARRHGALKRGGGFRPTALEEAALPVEQRAEALLAVDEAITRLAAAAPDLAQVVECRFFAGLTEEETAAALGTSTRSVQRQWRSAKAWLYQDLTS